MGTLFSQPSVAKYKISDYEKIRPGKFVYKKDKKNVYWRGNIVFEADGYNFTDLGFGYGKDTKNLYYQGKNISKLYSGFTVLNNGYAKDSRNVYFNGKITTADPNSIRISKKKYYAKDIHDKFLNT